MVLLYPLTKNFYRKSKFFFILVFYIGSTHIEQNQSYNQQTCSSLKSNMKIVHTTPKLKRLFQLIVIDYYFTNLHYNRLKANYKKVSNCQGIV